MLRPGPHEGVIGEAVPEAMADETAGVDIEDAPLGYGIDIKELF